MEDIIYMPANGVVSMIEKREMARNANSFTANVSVLSSYRHEVKKFPDNHRSKPPGFRESCSASRNKRAPCPECRKQFSPFVEGPSGWNSKPYELCVNCFRARRNRRRKGQSGSTASSLSSITNQDLESLQVVLKDYLNNHLLNHPTH